MTALPPSAFTRSFPISQQIQRRGWEAAYELMNTFADRLTLGQRVRMTVTTIYEPERLGWQEAGQALALWAMVVEVRV